MWSMGKWEMVRLGDVCIVERGGSPRLISNYITNGDNGINWIKIGDTAPNSMYITKTEEKIIPAGVKKSRYVHEGDFLLSNSMSFGRPYILKIDGCIHDGWLLLRDKEKLFDKRFLYYYLSSDRVYDEFKSMVVGGVVNNLNSQMVRNLYVPLPPLPIQQKIADVLDRANTLIEKRKAQIEKMNLLVKSRFIEMFGDPVVNEKGWEQVTLRDVSLRMSDGPFGSNLKSSHYAESGVRVIRLQNIGVSEFLDSDKAFIPMEHYETLKKYTCLPGDVVIGTLGEPNLRACILPEHVEIAINKADCVHFVPDISKVVSCFVCEYINQPATLAIAGDSIHGQTRARISMSQVAALPIYVPPLDLQTRFADFVRQADKSKVGLQNGLDTLQRLYKSLTQKCFNGDLF